MKCPKCKKEMLLKKKDVSHNFKTGKEYSRSIYWCKSDDIWANLEIPTDSSSATSS